MSAPFDYAQLDPGIRELVRLLHAAGFPTMDSGDGKSKPEDERALDQPHVIVRVEAADLIAQADRLHALLARHGIAIDEHGYDEREPAIGASYDPANRIAVIALTGVDDEMLARSRT